MGDHSISRLLVSCTPQFKQDMIFNTLPFSYMDILMLQQNQNYLLSTMEWNISFVANMSILFIKGIIFQNIREPTSILIQGRQ